ncbi:DUF6122 family protein [Winogradskyella immobilis]|uniref:LexA-binding, inner membrane-associated hydrolase n=1 Tax=Winogradskyella immobilis TaxID=2816852 RepID=A0ABS8EQ32_9FLAO|nr:DUF6122 family protein [Winogradskyella immobilis]MCC1484942.1 hypothetical protein [Winogradskyella immobilis]MCG0017034.1 DUF6122 family protein [Winogradskyella immobilis]
MFQSIIHYGIHFGFPLIIALLFFKKNWKKAYLIMFLGILIDLDHLLANPVFDANRCSINFHLLHRYYAIGIYLLLSVIKKTRLIGLGLIIHIFADSVDCALM